MLIFEEFCKFNDKNKTKNRLNVQAEKESVRFNRLKIDIVLKNI